MPARRKPDRIILALLADAPDGVTDATLAVHGIAAARIASLAAAGLVTATPQPLASACARSR